MRIEKRVDRTGRIVRGEQVHTGVQDVGRVVFRECHHLLAKLRAVILAADIAEDGLLQRIIHHAVQLVVDKIAPAAVVGDLVRCVLPDLADQNGAGLDLPDAAAQPEHEFVRQLVYHVQPPAVRARHQPARGDGVRPVDDIVEERGVQFVHAMGAS